VSIQSGSSLGMEAIMRKKVLARDADARLAVPAAILESARQSALLKTGALQDAIFNSANFSSIATDAKGVIQIFNVGAERMLGYTAAEVMDKITPADISDPQEVITRAKELSVELATPITAGFEALVFKASRGIEDIYELTYIRKDGSRFPAIVSVTALRDAQDAIIGYLLIGTDNTARKQANEFKDSFLAIMSHEIRTPLSGLLGMLELLSLSSLNVEQSDLLNTARDSGRSLLRILNDVLDWSKIEQGKLQLAPVSTSIEKLLTDVVNTYAQVASEVDVTLLQRVDARLSPAHKVDSLRLSQVLNNFVSNAIKFSSGGQVELRAELLERNEQSEQVRFSVTDTGIGIDADVLQRLFRFYGQGAPETARMYGGTGLGLAICKRLSELLGGRIDVQSTLGQGSTFSITLMLPVSEAAEVINKYDYFSETIVLRQPPPGTTADQHMQSPDSEADPVTGRPMTDGAINMDAPLVLVVDDHPINRKLLTRQLEILGFLTEDAHDGQAALALWRQNRYALIITDCHMPVMDGYALARAIRTIEADEARPRTPIFAWTANAQAVEIENCQTAGIDELLVKPTELSVLKRRLGKWLSIPRNL
jgi:two-component system, NarL family, sensor histidine kinase EvgS